MSAVSGTTARSTFDAVASAACERMTKLPWGKSMAAPFMKIWDEMSEGISNNSDDLYTISENYLTRRGLKIGQSYALTPRADRLVIDAVYFLLAHKNMREGCKNPGHFRHRLPLPLPESFERTLTEYGRFSQQYVGLSAGTFKSRETSLRHFLHFVYQQAGLDLANVQPILVSEYVISIQDRYNPQTLRAYLHAVRSFLRFLAVTGHIKGDIRHLVPRARTFRDKRIPVVLPPEVVRSLLSTVDRNTRLGKRDYAILLLAARYGLRGCDIRCLKLQEIKWSEGRIEVVQQKTREPLVLPLFDDVAEALIDYICNARTKIPSYREVFLKHNHPLAPLSSVGISQIFFSNARKVDLRLPVGTRAGMRSFRQTLATNLLEAGTPITTIANVLGHVTAESTNIYTKVNTKQLSEVGIMLSEVSNA